MVASHGISVGLRRASALVQDMLVDALGQASLLREKQRLSHKAIQLLKKKASMLTSVSNLGAAKLQEERTELERQLQGDLAVKECQVLAYAKPMIVFSLNRIA